MNSFEVIETYLPEAVDKYFVEDSKTVLLEKGNKFIDVNFNEAGYVKIATILMDGLSDYYQTQQNSVGFTNPALARPNDPANYAAYAGNIASGSRDGFAIGGIDVQWEIFKLQWVRGRQFRIDYIANEETAGAIIGNALEEFHRVHVVPEVDVARFSYLADQTASTLGNYKVETVDDDEPIYLFNKAIEWMNEMGVPADSQVFYVSTPMMTKVRNTQELTRFITQGDFRSEQGLTFNVEKYMGRPIVEVQSDRFFTNALLTQNGYSSTSNSKLINYMCVSTKASVPIRKIEYQKIFGPELSGLAGFHGYLINYQLYHGIFVPRNKLPGVYVSVSSAAASTKVDLLRIDARAINGTQWTLKNYFTNPAGLRGTIVYSASALGDLGSDITIDGSTVKATFVGDVVTEAATATYYFGLVDAAGKLIAKTSEAVTVITIA